MGMWEEFCLVCGGPPYVFFDDLGDDPTQPPIPPPDPSDYAWLTSFVGISHKEEVIPLADYDGYGCFTATHPTYASFDLGCRNKYDDTTTEPSTETHGYACHTACYALLQHELNYTLKYANVRPLLEDADWCDLNKFSWSDYGGMAEYHSQGFCEESLLRDGNLWMIEDPSKCEQNRKRILKLWRCLVDNGFQRPAKELHEDLEDLNLDSKLPQEHHKLA